MYLLIFCTASSLKEARKIAQALLKAKACACVNLVGKVDSHYWWQGEIEQAQEILLLIKTEKTHYQQVEKIIRTNHSYQVPEIIATEITQGAKKYLAWLHSSLG